MFFNITEGQSESLPTYYQLIISSYEMFCKIHKKDIISDIIKCWNQTSNFKLQSDGSSSYCFFCIASDSISCKVHLN